jgi:hypothetical protein
MIRSEILGLYKRLLRYGENLKFTDKKYFVYRIKKDFLDNRDLKNKKEIEFHYKVISALYLSLPPTSNYRQKQSNKICRKSMTKSSLTYRRDWSF